MSSKPYLSICNCTYTRWNTKRLNGGLVLASCGDDGKVKIWKFVDTKAQ
jgi:hypothetical protein